jgi:hypothetical protein
MADSLHDLTPRADARVHIVQRRYYAPLGGR